MLVFWKQRLVLLAVPKTGTSAYARALAPHAGLVVSDPPELKHAPVYRYNRFFRPMFEKMGAGQMDVAAVIREPVSWLGSWYRYRQRGFLDGRPVSTRGLDFDTFVAGYLSEPRPAWADVGQQSKFVAPRPNGTRVTHLFRYEDQAALIGFLEERLGVALDLPRENVSPRADLDLSPDLRARLRRRCAADFALWEGIGRDAAPPRA
ncbi:gamma-glutamyl kinase [Roseivivax sp. CAU 1761]